MFYNTRLFHTSGTHLRSWRQRTEIAIECIRKFKEQGTLISFDVNYRANLWTGEEARACIEQILPFVDIFFCSEDTARLTSANSTIEEIQKSFCEEYPISVVAPQSARSSLQRNTILLPLSILQKMILTTARNHTTTLMWSTVSEAVTPMFPVLSTAT